MSAVNTSTPAQSLPGRHIYVYVLTRLWLIAFMVYLPAAKAGWVIDSSGWLYNIRHLSFFDYVNNSQSGIPSLYQFTQLATWVFYKLFNANPYAWHILMVSMHTANAFLLYVLCVQLFHDSGIRKGRSIALAGAVLYTICPQASEVVVWEAAYHYLQGFLFILAILLLVQRYLHQPKAKYAWVAGVLYFCSSYSLEVFYLTPWLALALAVYYRRALGYNRVIFRQVLRYFFVPQLFIFGLHIAVLLWWYHTFFAHISGSGVQPVTSYLCRPPQYLFHILLQGRFFPAAVRKAVYAFFQSAGGIALFYGIVAALCIVLAARARRLTAEGRMALLLLIWCGIAMIIIMPLAFPNILLVVYDRYTYVLSAFVYMLLALLGSCIGGRRLRWGLLAAYVVMNLFFTVRLNLLWKHSAYVNSRLLHDLPQPGGRTIILLDIPESLQGVPMIGAQPDGEFKKLYELYVGPLSNKVYDAASFNMLTADAGAHVTVLNDSTLQVALNQWGAWWWYAGRGGFSYANADYSLNMIDPGHRYLLTLKHPAAGYLLLYQTGAQWKEVNMGRRNTEQY